jgi:hypothetical protein
MGLEACEGLHSVIRNTGIISWLESRLIVIDEGELSGVLSADNQSPLACWRSLRARACPSKETKLHRDRRPHFLSSLLETHLS